MADETPASIPERHRSARSERYLTRPSPDYRFSSSNISASVVPSALASRSAATIEDCCSTPPEVTKATLGAIIRRIGELSVLSLWPPLPPCPWVLR